MSHYRPNIRDLEFNLFEVFNTGTRMGTEPFQDMSTQTAREILSELGKLACGPVAASFADGDRNPPVFDPATHSVTIPESFKASYRAVMDGEWWRLVLAPDLGGYGAPPTLQWATAELILGANPAVFMYAAGPNFAQVVYRLGTKDQQKLALLMIERGWGSTMVLTEPDAGSDVGTARTKAILQDDGSWHLTGVKRFITSGDQDMTENIVHLVLARPEGPGVETRPGTKGLSLFAVPKFHVDVDSGELGERNGVFVTGLEHKMGIKVSTTCELTFGQHGTPAVGTLIGDVHDGIAQMFHIIEYARMMVGTKAIATLSSGYLNALDYAQQRVQGSDLGKAADKTAPRVTIMHHPDVRRILMRQKAYAEGLRALYFYAADQQDRIAMDADGAEALALAEKINDLLLPIVKGVGSERAYENLALSLQTFGGSGFTQDYPIEQYIRDAKIDTLYEGTTAIQALDFFFRKIIRDNGVALGAVSEQIQSFLDSLDTRFDSEKALLTKAFESVQVMVGTLVGYAMASQSDPNAIYKVGEHAVTLLMSVGDLLIGYLLLRQAVVAETALPTATERDCAFYTGKVAVANWFCRNVLPEIVSRTKVVQAADTSLMEVPEGAF